MNEFVKKIIGENISLTVKENNSDLVSLYIQWLNDFSSTDYLGKSNRILTREDEERFLSKNNPDERVFMILENSTDTIIGAIGLHKIDFINRNAVLGIFIGNPEARNKHYGREAINLLLDYGFNYLNLKSISLALVSANEKAYKCYKSVGFKDAGRLRSNYYVNGKYYDQINMDIIKEEFSDSYILNKEL